MRYKPSVEPRFCSLKKAVVAILYSLTTTRVILDYITDKKTCSDLSPLYFSYESNVSFKMKMNDLIFLFQIQGDSVYSGTRDGTFLVQNVNVGHRIIYKLNPSVGFVAQKTYFDFHSHFDIFPS